MYAQIIDDVRGRTVLAVTSLMNGFKDAGNTVERASLMGRYLGKLAFSTGLGRDYVYDRSGMRFHGKVAGLLLGFKRGLDE